MKTVGDYRKAGLTFVRGDMIDGMTGKSNSVPFDPFILGNPNGFSECWTMRSFAWRENTDDIIGFSGLVEVVWRNTQKEIVHTKSILEEASSILKWRPYLKSQYEEDFCSDKEESQLPDIGFTFNFQHGYGSKWEYLYDEKYGWEYGDNLKVIYLTTNHNGVDVAIVFNCQEDVLNTAVISDPDFFDVRTEREKVVDAALALDEYEGGVGLSSRKFCEKLYDSGMLRGFE